MDIRAVEFAHDLKMPIQLIYSCVQLLEMELQAGSRADGYLKLLNQSAHQLQRMVTNALDEDELQRGQHKLRLSMRDLVADVRDVCTQMALFADERGIDVRFQTNAAAFVMWIDGEKLERILHNLLSNALRFTPEGGSVTVGVQLLGDSVEISVSDTGCGVAEVDRERIFCRGVTDGGHGHGLAIVREYAALLGGSVRAESNSSPGSRFVLRLPVQN